MQPIVDMFSTVPVGQNSGQALQDGPDGGDSFAHIVAEEQDAKDASDTPDAGTTVEADTWVRDAVQALAVLTDAKVQEEPQISAKPVAATGLMTPETAGESEAITTALKAEAVQTKSLGGGQATTSAQHLIAHGNEDGPEGAAALTSSTGDLKVQTGDADSADTVERIRLSDVQPDIKKPLFPDPNRKPFLDQPSQSALPSTKSDTDLADASPALPTDQKKTSEVPNGLFASRRHQAVNDATLKGVSQPIEQDHSMSGKSSDVTDIQKQQSDPASAAATPEMPKAATAPEQGQPAGLDNIKRKLGAKEEDPSLTKATTPQAAEAQRTAPKITPISHLVASAPAMPAPAMPLAIDQVADVEGAAMVEFGLSETDRASPQIIKGRPEFSPPALTRHISQQMIDILRSTSERPVEVSLSPEELGRVKLNIVGSEAGITVQILAERPETSDLLRRHIEILADDFRGLGYEDINFSFGSEGSSDQSDHLADGQGGDAPQTHAAPDIETTPIQINLDPAEGLDLRL